MRFVVNKSEMKKKKKKLFYENQKVKEKNKRKIQKLMTFDKFSFALTLIDKKSLRTK
jgi:phosphotransacetylase